MSWDNKVVWSEGMFLRTQHFQQADRHTEWQVRSALAAARAHPWGVTDLQINREMLAAGKFAISRAAGMFEDGTPFTLPDGADHPAPLDLADSVRNCTVYLGLPVRQPGGVEVELDDTVHTPARYRAADYDAADSVSRSDQHTTLQESRQRLRLLLETEERDGYTCIGLARIIEVRSDKNVVLDEGFIAPCLTCTAAPVLSGFVAELQGLIHHRAEAVAARVTDSGTKGAAEIADFLLLQAVNRYEPLLTHLISSPMVHPEDFYRLAVQMAGELDTFTVANRRPPAFPPYRHDDLQRSFRPVMAELRHSLSAVIDPTAVPIPLQERRYGVRVAVISDRSLLTTATFVLVVKADMQMDAIRRLFPTQTTIGPVEKIRDLVNSALAGIRTRPLQVAPRQLPYTPNATYFELERNSPFWKELTQSGGMALHVAGDFPQLEMELWAIKG